MRAHQQAVAQQDEHHRAQAKVHQVFHQDVAGVLGPGKAALHHGKAALHEEDQHGANQKPNAQGNAFQFHCSIAPFSVLHTGGWCGTFRLICQSIPLFLSFRNDRSKEMTCKNTPYFRRNVECFSLYFVLFHEKTFFFASFMSFDSSHLPPTKGGRAGHPQMAAPPPSSV